jgi:hypothetical protein
VNERWVCKRCFADNEGTVSACHKCGLIRGAESTPTDQADWSAQAQAAAGGAPPQAGWTKWLRLWWIPALAVALVVGYFVSVGTKAVDEIQAGDCFNVGDEVEISDVNSVACTESHLYEAFHVQDHQTSSFPTDPEMDAIFTSICSGPFETFVGTAYDDSALWATMITPSPSSFSDGDRGYICVLYEPDPDDPLDAVAVTESMQGSNR